MKKNYIIIRLCVDTYYSFLMWAHITIMGLIVVAVKQYCSVAHVNAGIPPPHAPKNSLMHQRNPHTPL